MSIRAKSTAVAIATVSSVLFYSVPSQAGEYGYLHELETMVQQEGVNYYSDKLSVSEKLERGKEYCELLEREPIEKVFISLLVKYNNLSQEGYSNRAIYGFIFTETSILHASAIELCPEYKYKIDNFLSENSEQEES